LKRDWTASSIGIPQIFLNGTVWPSEETEARPQGPEHRGDRLNRAIYRELTSRATPVDRRPATTFEEKLGDETASPPPCWRNGGGGQFDGLTAGDPALYRPLHGS